jgi:putative peptide maturation dehydrogenase
MTMVKRSRYTFFVSNDRQLVDINGLLKGAINISSQPILSAISIVGGETIKIDPVDVALLLEIPSDNWLAIESIPGSQRDQLENLALKALVLTDQASSPYREHRDRHELMESSGWDPYAALFHFMTRWSQMDLFRQGDNGSILFDERTIFEEALGDYVQSLGAPPAHFHAINDPVTVRDLPLIKRTGGLYDVLTARKTIRAYAAEASITTDELATILYYVFGCHGYSYASADLVNLQKTSPSGGSLHPIEVYPLVLSVEDLDSGIYHYNIEHHSLEMVSGVDRNHARETARLFVAGQTYFASAAVLFILTSRFYRNQWKYRFNTKTYGVMLMDAAHLSQTLYLVCTELGLGAFITGAINNQDIDAAIGIDGFVEGSLVVLGCGKPADSAAGELEPSFVAYTPRATTMRYPG